MIPVNTPRLDGNEAKYLAECIETGWISSEGPFIGQFEKGMAEYVGRRHGVAVCNGTAALELAVAALELGDGDEIIMPTFTIISCALAAVRRGCKPVLVDCDPITWNMDVSAIEEKISARTRAIMVVHIYGLPVDMDPVLALARKHGVAIIEDAAEMHGQSYRGRACGSFGDISTFSFYPNKHVTTGEGGMVLTDDDRLAERCRSLRNLCFIPEQRFVHYELGYNFRMTNLQAALGLAQLERLDAFAERKRAIGRRYSEQLADLPMLELPAAGADYAESIYWVYGVVLSDTIAPRDAAWCMKALGQRGIGTRPFFFPMHEQPVFRARGWYADERYPVAERLARRGLYLPSGLGLSDAEVDAVVAAVREVLA